MPKGAPTFSEALRQGAEVFHSLKPKCFKDRGLSTAVGDEGGFAPNLEQRRRRAQGLHRPRRQKKQATRFGEDIFIALDVASSEFYDKEKGKYVFKKSDRRSRKDRRRTRRLLRTASSRSFPIISIEDGCDENDWDGWKTLSRTKLATKPSLWVTTFS